MPATTPSSAGGFKAEEFWNHARGVARHVPFLKDAIASYYCTLDAKTPLYAKGVLVAALAYFALPMDAIPDVLVGIGFTDDASVLAAAIAAIGGNIKDRHYEQAESFLQGE